MKSIILFRHGEAGWKNNIFGKDYDKPLTLMGIKEAEKMGMFLSNINSSPDLVISSTAFRAKTTAELAHKAGDWNSIINFESKIYGGNSNFLLNLISNQNNKYNSICLVGHEPNFSSFISLTTGKYKLFSTASMAKIDFETNQWEEVISKQGSLDWLRSPQKI